MLCRGLINTVLGYKKGSKTKNIFSKSENMMFDLSNALSIVFISLKVVKIRQVKVLSVAPPKGHETLRSIFFYKNIHQTEWSKNSTVDFDVLI